MCFGHIDDGDPFDVFLKSIALNASLGNKRFVARNFLLDEGVAPERQQSYESMGVMANQRMHESWHLAHTEYLLARVFLPQVYHIPKQIDPSNDRSCAETFRSHSALKQFGAADARLDLIRIELIDPIQRATRFSSSSELISLAQRVLKNPTAEKEKQRLNSVLEMWQRSCDLRPVWAGFWEDMADVFGREPLADPPGWIDELRDRLGLYHINPYAQQRNEIPVFVFRYPVKALPLLKGERALRPIAVPTVLDGKFSEAFCPAPSAQPCGYVVYLGEQPYRIRRELLHPPIHFRAHHLFRVGNITKSLPVDLTDARREHLRNLRAQTKRNDYAQITDGDLL